MTQSIFNESNQALGFIRELEDCFDNMNIFKFLVCPYVIDFSSIAFMQNCVYGFAIIFNIEPISNVLPSSIHRNRPVQQRVDYGLGNQLFRMLKWAIVVRGSRY